MLYELIYLKLAFPRGQFDDPEIPSDLSDSGIFSSVLPKYFKAPFSSLISENINRFMCFVLRMLEKDCLVRISSRRLLAELEELLEE